ncbi:MAG: hypothetical protein EBY16_00660 [Gammaproteobacteria bacterium]|nr:hypothetical protein [Gammaproteobacteria bacterium]
MTADLDFIKLKHQKFRPFRFGCQTMSRRGISQIIDKLIASTANDKMISTGKCLEAMILT